MTTTPTVWEALHRVNTTDQPPPGAHLTATNTQGNSRVVALTGGRYLIAWEDSSSTFAGGLEPRDIVGQVYDALGNPIGAEFSLSSFYQDLDQKQADIAALQSGGFICAYQSSDAAGFNDRENIAVQVYDASGAFVRIDDFRQLGPGPDDSRPTVTTFANGSYLLAYEEDIGGGVTNLVGYLVDSAGVKSPKFDVVPGASAVAETAAVSALLSNGNYVVAYQSATGSGDIQFIIRSTTGPGTTAGTVAVSAGAETEPEVAALTGGGFVVVWEDANGDGAGNAGIKARIFSNTGVAPNLGFTPPTTTAGAQSAPAVTALSDGGFLIAWRDDSSLSVKAQRFDANGLAVGGEFAAAALNSTSAPALALLGDGRVLLSVTNANAGNLDVHAVIFDPRTEPIVGTNAADVLTSRREGAVVLGNGGDDTLYGLEGNDTLNGGNGTDTMSGGAGDDTYFTDRADPITEVMGEGTDTVRSVASYVLSANVENLVLLNAAGISGTGNSGANTLTGNSGNNILNGGGGTDTLIGGLGNDIYYTDGGDTITELATEGTDTVYSSVTYTLGTELENLVMQGSAPVDGTGNGGANTLNGLLSSAANVLTGLGGDDTYIIATGDQVVEALGGGTDTVQSAISYTLAANVENLVLINAAGISGYGNSGANTLTGSGGNNTLNGGDGNDTLTGGLGNDSFYFNTAPNDATNRDTITDFDVPADTILLENAIFASLTATGTLNASFFVTGTQALDTNDFIIYDPATGALVYDSNGSTAGNAVQFATLSTGLALTNNDFSIL